MSSKKKTAKKGKGKDKGGKNKKNEEIEELRSMIQALKVQIDAMSKTIKKQNKRISSLETDNKRTKKAIHKLQINGGDGGGQTYAASTNTLLSPKESLTVPTDIDQSDAESISTSKDEDDDSKEDLKAKSVPPPKPVKTRPVARRNKPVPKKKASDIKFTFDMSHQKIKYGDNGAAAMKPKVYGGTIRFGRFLHFTKNNKDNIASFIITFDTRSIGQSSSLGFGFATTSFGSWVGSNFGQNNSVIIKGNAQYLHTDKIFKFVEGKEYKHKGTVDVLKNPDNPKEGFFKDGHDMAVSVDLKDRIGRVWNDTLNKDGADKERVFEIGLPDDYEICIAVYMGGSAKKKLIVKEQKYVFNEE